MAVSVLFKNRQAGKIGEIDLDCTISESHVYKNTITKYPVEDGSVITDHIINDPETITMVGFITNTPVNYLGGKIGNIIRGKGENRVKLAFSTLTDIFFEKLPVDVVTGLKTYRNMYFQTLDIPRDSRTGDSLRFTATLTRIIKVSSKIVQVQNLSQDVEGTKANTKDTASQTVNKGKQPVSQANEGQKTRASIALQGARKSKQGLQYISSKYLF